MAGRSPCTLVGDGDLDVQADDVESSAELFAAAGLCIFRDMLPVHIVDGCHDCYQHRAEMIDACLMSRAVDLSTQFRFNEVVRRRAARYDVCCSGEPGFCHPALLEDAPWLPFVHAVLGDNATECWRGVVDNRPGSVVQGWHRDGQPLFDHAHLPAHCLGACSRTSTARAFPSIHYSMHRSLPKMTPFFPSTRVMTRRTAARVMLTRSRIMVQA